MTQSSSRDWTIAGLLLALLAIPAVTLLNRVLAPDPGASGAIIVRELAILGFTALLIWIVRSGEGLPLSSIGIRTDRIGRSLAWGLGLAVACFAALFACLAVFSQLGIHYGEGQSIARSLPVILLTVVRAGISEEVFYRGFALERLQAWTGSKWIAAAVSLIIFAGFHYRQGLPGVFLAFTIGAVLTAFYVWKRDLIAAMFGHFLVDFIPNVILPWFGDSK
jgi:membrane protease YdiL (CAAX protease family)